MHTMYHGDHQSGCTFVILVASPWIFEELQVTLAGSSDFGCTKVWINDCLGWASALESFRNSREKHFWKNVVGENVQVSWTKDKPWIQDGNSRIKMRTKPDYQAYDIKLLFVVLRDLVYRQASRPCRKSDSQSWMEHEWQAISMAGASLSISLLRKCY